MNFLMNLVAKCYFCYGPQAKRTRFFNAILDKLVIREQRKELKKWLVD